MFDNLKGAIKGAGEKIKQYSQDSKEAKAPVEGAIVRYGVIYLGGLAKYPKKQSTEIGFNITHDGFYLKPTQAATWFEDLAISYDKIKKFEIVKRQVSTMESLIADDARSLETNNNIEITYLDTEGNEILLRLEMLTGITVNGQAGKCKEMLDILRQNNILKQLNKETSSTPDSSNIPEQIKKLKELFESGILNEDEFNTKKAELLARM